jgi:hypothetical protein
MQYFKATVRLSGSTMNEVEKILSAPEILILQFIHGGDAITRVKFLKSEAIDLREEKDRLRGLYDSALKKREQSIDTIFGPLGSVVEKLPQEQMELFGLVDEEDIFAVAKSATKVDKSGREPQTQTQANRLDHIVQPEEVSFNDIAG